MHAYVPECGHVCQYVGGNKNNHLKQDGGRKALWANGVQTCKLSSHFFSYPATFSSSVPRVFHSKCESATAHHAL